MTDQKQIKKAFLLNDAALFDLIILIFFLLMTVIAFDYNPRARSIPLILGTLGSFMMLMQFLADAIPPLRSKLRFVVQSGLLSGEKQAEPESAEKQADAVEAPGPPKTEKASRYWWQVLRIVLWLTGFIIALSLVNYLIAVGAFIVLITKTESGESWKKALLLAGCVDVCFFILFDIILNVQL